MFEVKEIYTKSNLLSLFRLFLAIPLWILLDDFEANRFFVFGLCLFAAFTDILDGYIARKYNEITEFGKIIDPLADKIAMAAVVIKLFLIGEIPGLYFYLIIGRDLLIFLGGLVVSRKLGMVLPSNKLGKITVLIVGTVLLFILLGFNKDSLIYLIFYYLSIVLIFASFSGYIIRAAEFMKRNSNVHV
ncbi:MAG: CDP-alcohol phosphatidyltransferase family protein [Ignavibacteriaceae bacterium]